MANDTNKDILQRLESKTDGIAKIQAAMQLEFALKISALENKQDMKFMTIEKYLKSDPDTKQEGAIEKLDRMEKIIDKLKIRVVALSVSGGALFVAFKWMVTKIF